MNNENNLVYANDEEKMKAKFRRLRKAVEFIQVILLIGPIIMLMFLAALSISILAEPSENETEIANETIEITTDDNTEDITAMVPSYIKDFEDENLDNIASVVSVPIVIVSYVLIFSLLNQLKKIFYEVETKGTPFTEKSVNSVDKISKLTLTLGVIRIISSFILTTNEGVGLIFVIIILAISSIFKYGYKLQKESDETL
jgi:hypothetical protein